MSRLTDEQIVGMAGGFFEVQPELVQNLTKFARAIESAVHRVDQPTDIHSCSYFCDRPSCIKEQRDAFRDSLPSGSGAPGEGNEGE